MSVSGLSRLPGESKLCRPVLWCVLAVLAAVYFFTLFYTDILITYEHGLRFLDSLVDGSIFDFYLEQNSGPARDFPVYFPPVYVLFALWNLPCWLFIRLGLTEALSAGCLLWAKLLPALASLGCVWLFGKMLQATETEDREFWSFQICASLFFVLPVLAVVQYDTLELFIALWGFLLASREEHLSWKTLAVLSLAVSIKLLMLFPIVLLILLKEKRFLYILRDGICLFAVSIVSLLPFLRSYLSVSTEFNGGMGYHLLAVAFPTGFRVTGASIFCILYLALCVVAHCKKVSTAAEFFRFACWLSAAHFFVFFAFSDLAHPYWMVLMGPFVLALLAQNPGRTKLNLLLEILYELCLVFLHCFQFQHVYLTNDAFAYLTLKNAPAMHLFSAESFGQFFSDLGQQLLPGMGIELVFPGVAALMIVCAGSLLVLNHPFRGVHYSDSAEPAQLAMIKNSSCIIRLILLAGFFALSLVFAFIM